MPNTQGKIEKVSRWILTIDGAVTEHRTFKEAKAKLDKASQGTIKPEFQDYVCGIPGCVGCP
jgi:hypothetical protein